MRDHVRRRARKLGTFYRRIVGCHVVVGAPHRRRLQGKRYHVRVDITVPGQELVIGRNPPADPKHEDMHAAVDEAFDSAERAIHDYAGKLHREDRVARCGPPRGRIVKLFKREGYGFLESTEGYEIYFHKNAVREDRFRRLTVGTEVRFTEEAGEKGPQASTVDVVGKG